MNLILVAVISLEGHWLDCRSYFVCGFKEICCV